MNKKILYYLLISALSSLFFGIQNAGGQTDSLKQLLSSLPEDTIKVKKYFELSQQFEEVHNDSLYIYYLKKTLELAEKTDYKRGQIWYYDEMGYYYRQNASYGKALENHLKAMHLAENIDYIKYLPRINNNIGVVYRRLDDYKSAVDYHLKAMKYAKQANDTQTMMYAQNSLGNVFILMEQYEQAKEYLNQALQQAKKTNNYRSLAINYNNIGELYEAKGQMDKALKYYFTSLEYNRKIESQRGIAISFDCIGSVYNKSGKYKKAIQYFQKAITIDDKIGDTYYVAVSNLNIGYAYLELGMYEQSEKYLQNALNLALKIGAKSTARDAYKYLSRLYDEQNKKGKALDYYKDYTVIKDSILNEKNSKNISKLQTLYETEKQRKEIALLEQEKRQREKSNRRKTFFLILLGIAFAILAVLAFALYRANIIKRKNNKILEKQSKLINEKNEALREQKRRLEHTNTKITDSLLYAQKIQYALLPGKNLLNELFTDHFIIYHPLSVVSGDFYWAGKFEDKIIFTVADCTGHGVPGAMMSMLGNSYLSESIRKPQIQHAHQILDEMRNMVVASLHQKGVPGESKDGMEMSLCIYDRKTHQLEFAGAHISIYIISEPKDKNNHQPQLTELKGDRMPIGYYRKMHPFTSQTYKIQPTDTIYLFTDGYIDQFGGAKGRKFQSNAFKNLLKTNAGLPLIEQKQLIEDTFINWKQNNEQIDDVLVMGIKLPVD